MPMVTRGDGQDTSVQPMDAGDMKGEQDLSEQPTVLEYARFNSLTIEYTTESIFPESETRPMHVGDALWDQEALVSSVFEDAITAQLQECLGIPRSSIQLLSEVCKAPIETQFVIEFASSISVASLKLDLPLLKTDEEYELLHFGKRAEADLQNTNIKPVPADESRDEGLTWPPHYLELPGKITERISKEKLEVSEGAINLIRETIQGGSDIPELRDSNSGLDHRGLRATRPLTPPLLPLSPPLTLFIPCTPTDGLLPLSDPPDSPTADTAAIERRLMADDALGTGSDSAKCGQALETLQSLAETPASSIITKRKISDLRVEGPLTPRLPTEYPSKRTKGVSFPEMLHEYIPNLPSDAPSSGDADIDRFIVRDLAPFARKAEEMLKNDKLIAADSTRRVKVPAVTDKILVAPWQEYSKSPPRKQSKKGSELELQSWPLSHVKKQDMDRVQPWHGNSKLERSLSWTPFPFGLAKADLCERIEASNILTEILAKADNSEILDISTLCYKREGLRILDDAWEPCEEDLELANFDVEDVQLDEIVRRQSAHAAVTARTGDDLTLEMAPRVKQSDPQAAQMFRRTKAMPPRETSMPDDGLLFGGGLFGTNDITDLLNGTGKPPQLHRLPVQAVAAPRKRQPLANELTEVSEISELPATLGLPSPDLPSGLSNRPLVVRSGFFTGQRSLISHIRELWPSTELIEREWNANGPQHGPRHGKYQQMPDEGDIIASPSTTILLTSLAKLKQRPLPGQEAFHYGVKERLAAVAMRFERVLILISGGTSTMHRAFESFDARDAQAVGDLAGVGASMQTEVEVNYVAGGDQEVAKWIVAMVLRYPVTSSDGVKTTKLLEEQTTWEMFLRRLGLNAFAAQAVLEALKGSSTSKTPENRSESPDQTPHAFTSSLGTFMGMAPDERMRTLAPVMGGYQVLKRVNQVLARGWRSS